MNKLLLAMLLGVTGSASVWAAGSDEQWEMTIKMDMPGMAMPAMKHTSCQPKDGAYKPDKSPQDKNCEMTDIQVSGNTTKWKMHCSGKDAMEGSGEMTRTADTMNGKIKMSMKQGQMTQIISGKRVGTCDAAGERKKIEDKVNASLSEMCAQQVDGAVKSGGYEPKMPELFAGKGQCAASKSSVCDKARAFVSGYNEYAIYAKSRGWVAAECGINLEAKRVELCKKAGSERKFKFVKESCPAEAKAFKAEYDKNCQGFGHGYTVAAAHPNAKLCHSLSFWSGRAYNRGSNDDDSSAAEVSHAGKNSKKSKAAATENSGSNESSSDDKGNPAKAILDGAKSLKGVFGF